jgi:hypothetical protein
LVSLALDANNQAHELPWAELQEDDIFGETNFLLGGELKHIAVATSDEVVICFLEAEHIKRACINEDHLGARFFKLLATVAERRLQTRISHVLKALNAGAVLNRQESFCGDLSQLSLGSVESSLGTLTLHISPTTSPAASPFTSPPASPPLSPVVSPTLRRHSKLPTDTTAATTSSTMISIHDAGDTTTTISPPSQAPMSAAIARTSSSPPPSSTFDAIARTSSSPSSSHTTTTEPRATSPPPSSSSSLSVDSIPSATVSEDDADVPALAI